MWTTRFKVYDEKNKIMKIVRKNHITGRYYPVGHYIENKRYYFISVGVIQGEEKDKKEFFKDLQAMKKDKIGRRTELIEVEEDFFVLITSHTMTEENKWAVSVAFNPRLLHFMPPTWDKDGWEEWNVAALERKDLEKLLNVAETIYKVRLFGFEKKKITNFGFLTMLPELTDRQKEVLKFAVSNGYYKYPRQSSLDKLSRKFKINFSAFQAHIRKAENKIVPFVMNFISNINK
jgi:predicted DNA binding protein